MIRQIITLVVLSIMMSCGKSQKFSLSPNDYQSWMVDNVEQISRTKQTAIMSIETQYLPSEYLAYQDLKVSGDQLNQVNLDTLNSEYGCSLSFQISLHASDKETNLLYYNARDYSEYKQRVNYLNFNMESFISLQINDNQYRPSLTHFEGYHELSNKLVFHVAFNPSEYNCGKFEESTNDIRLTLEDPYWGSGINHFTFKKEHLEQLPQIALQN